MTTPDHMILKSLETFFSGGIHKNLESRTKEAPECPSKTQRVILMRVQKTGMPITSLTMKTILPSFQIGARLCYELN